MARIAIGLIFLTWLGNQKPGVSDWLYEPWYIDRILKPIRKAILYTPIIVNESGEKKLIKNDE